MQPKERAFQSEDIPKGLFAIYEPHSYTLPNRSGVSRLWPRAKSRPAPAFLSQALQEHSQAHSIPYCPWLLSSNNGRGECSQQRPRDPQSLKHSPSSPLQKTSADFTDHQLPTGCVRPVLLILPLAGQWFLKIERPNFKSQLSECMALETFLTSLDFSFLVVKGGGVTDIHPAAPRCTHARTHACIRRAHAEIRY